MRDEVPEVDPVFETEILLDPVTLTEEDRLDPTLRDGLAVTDPVLDPTTLRELDVLTVTLLL